MIDLRGKFIAVRDKEELIDLFEYAEKQGFKFNSGNILSVEYQINYPNIIHFWKDRTVTYNASTDNEFYWYEIKDITEMSAREFLQKFIKHRCCAGRTCEECILSYMNTKNARKMCDLDNWKKEDIDYLIELVSKDDSIYHPPMDDVRAALCIDDILGKSDKYGLSVEEEKVLKYVAEKLREVEE